MESTTIKSHTPWYFWFALASLLVAVPLQVGFLLGGWDDPAEPMGFAGIVNMLIAGRLFVAFLRNERGKYWIFYSILPFLIIPAIKLACYFMWYY